MLLRFALALSLSAGLLAQSPHFEVASIKPSDPAKFNGSSGIGTRHGSVNASNVTLKRCIMGAYGIGPHQISGGPDWFNTERFDIVAKAEQPINDDAILMQMLQALLAERFQLAIHRETRTIPALVLEVLKSGTKLEKAGDGESVTNTSNGPKGATLDVKATGMDQFATVLAREMDLPVVNHTGLTGIFNFKLEWTPERAGADAVSADAKPSIFTAIQQQLGLRLRSEKSPVEVLIVDKAERPTEN